MNKKITQQIDFEKVNTLLEGFNKTTGFVTAILDFEGNVLSKSGWRQICTEFHRINPETSKKCTISDTELAGQLARGEKYHFYKCLNGLIDVVMPIVVNGEHIANLFSGQFFFEEPDISFFKNQARNYGFDEERYLAALKNVPIVSEEKVKTAMDFLLNITRLFSETTFQKPEQMTMVEALKKSESNLRLIIEHSPASIAMFDNSMRYLVASRRFLLDYNLGNQAIIGRSHYEVFPEIPEHWKEIHRRCLAGETISAGNDPFPRADGTIDWLRWEIHPWYESDYQIGGIILFSEVITAQIKAQEALKEREEKFKAVFESANVGKSITLPTGEINVNQAFCDMLGYTRGELQNKKWHDLTPEEEIPTVQKFFEPLIKGEKDSVRFEKRYICKNGTYIWADVSTSIRRDKNGKPLHFITTIIDITDRKRLEEERRLSEELFSNAFHVGPAGMTITRIADGKFIDANESFCKLFEFERDEVIGHTSTELNLWTPEERKRLIRQQLASGGLHNFELIAQSKSGRFINILFSSRHLELRGEACHITTMIDISKRKLTEEALRNSEERVRNAFENIPDVIVIYDKNLKIQHINAATLRISGRPVSDFIGKRDDEIWPREVYQAYLPTLEKALKSGKICSIETKLVLTNIGTQYLRITCIPILDESGNVHEVMGITHDFTKQKQAEENIQTERDFSNALLDGLPGIFYFYDSNFKFLRWNKNFETVSGYSGNEIAKMGPLDFFSDSEKDLLKERISEVFTKGYSEVEADFLAKDGTCTPYFLNGLKISYNNKDCLIGVGIDIAERKRAEAAVRESEERYRTIISNIPSGLIHIFDRDMRYVFNAGEELARLGLSNEFLVGKSIHEVLPSDVASMVESQYKRVLAGKTVRFEGGFGEDYFSLTSAPLRNTYGEIENILTLSVNITERKQAEIRLAESEERLRLATEQANVAVWEYDFNNNSMSRSGNHDKLYGLEWQSKWDINTFLNATHPEDREYSYNFIQKSVAPGGPDDYSFDFRVVFPDKTIRWLTVNGRVIERNISGQGIKVRGTLSDITEIKITELALRESEARYHNIIESAPVGIVVHQRGKVVFVNPAGIQIVGAKSIKQLIGKEITDIIHPGNLNESRKRIQRLTDGEKGLYPAEDKYIRLDGRVIDVEVMATLLTYRNEPAVQVIITDITERKRLRKELEQLNAELELKVEQRTALLEASNKELEAFSYSVSHDLRAPLRHISGYVNLLNEQFKDGLPEKAHHYLDTISVASSKMGTLIDELLQYSRTGRQELRKTELDMNLLVKEVTDQLNTGLGERKINWDIQVLPKVFGDYNLLKLVLTNLLDNAAKYTRNKKQVNISVTYIEEANDFVFCVRDNGVGFDMKYAHKLFGVFQRLHSQAEFEGAGIGLANVQRIVHKHLGRVWAEAEPGKGAKFYFSLPIKREEIL